jgi:hypothetical protein
MCINVVNLAKRRESSECQIRNTLPTRLLGLAFELVRGALGDLVDGEHFFDIVTDDVVYKVLYEFPGRPRVIQDAPI